MTENLEDQLARVLADRAETVHTAPAYRLVPDADAPAARVHADRGTTRRTSWSWQLSAVAFAAVVAVVVAVLVRTAGEHEATPPARRPSCMLVKSHGFATAVRHGLLPPDSVVLAGATDGSELLGTQRGGATTAINLLDSRGRVSEVWRAQPGQRVVAIANPYGAISTSFVAFALKSLSSHAVTTVVAAPHRTPVTLPGPTRGYGLSADPLTAPIASNETVSVLATSTTNPSDDRLFFYYSDAWQRILDGGRFSRVSQLLSAGGNLVLARRGAGGRVDLRFSEQQYRPSGLEPAAYTGFGFSSDGTTLTWLTAQRGWPSVWRWRPGDPTPHRVALPQNLKPTSASDNYVVERSAGPDAAQVVFNATSGVITYLPAGTDLVRVDGPVAVLSQPTATGLRYSRVPVRALTDYC